MPRFTLVYVSPDRGRVTATIEAVDLDAALREGRETADTFGGRWTLAVAVAGTPELVAEALQSLEV